MKNELNWPVDLELWDTFNSNRLRHHELQRRTKHTQDIFTYLDQLDCILHHFLFRNMSKPLIIILQIGTPTPKLGNLPQVTYGYRPDER